MGREWFGLWPSVVLFVWIVGVVTGWVRILWGRLQLLLLARKNRSAAGEYEGMARNLSRRIGVRRTVRVIVNGRRATPMTRGIARPVVFLPSTMKGWSTARKRSVLLHELRHIKRGDSCTLAFAYGICSLLWFVPPVWAAYARLYQEQEMACDAAVIESGVRRQAYAACILDTAQLCREPALLAGLGFSWGRKKLLKDRILAIVKEGKTPKRSLAALACAALLIGAAVLMGATGTDTGKKYGALHLMEYQVKNAEEAGVLTTLIQFENAFNSHELPGCFRCLQRARSICHAGPGTRSTLFDRRIARTLSSVISAFSNSKPTTTPGSP
jgi:beta-lactamase regulating signal transducer with metallopeptidase domain